ncbi:ABC transporter ATP-binding protein [Halalkalirubrum salinum]|uniref:ABC transporter ATP-binding protein n=1 Tax=Halalkalirubrum salinum TaxID=2563889 RepID=UPI0010FB2501|nr:ABC transporter ATP-binding protein [Halalkalirubrum salinum]
MSTLEHNNADTTSGGDTLVSVENLKKYFETAPGFLDRLFGDETSPVRAVDGVSFDVIRGETLGLVGESGCGKSTTGETVLRLQEPTDGSVTFNGEPVFELGGAALTEFRQRAQIVFQDPFSSLDPRQTIGATVRQPLDVHGRGTLDERNERVRNLLERVGLSADQFDRYPHEFSGGQRQRIGIARALALDPDFVVLDEPTSALDVSVQAQVLNLLDELQTEFGLTYLLISHDLSVIRQVCDRVAVMYLGEIVEMGPIEEIFTAPRHPYTEALLDSVPRPTTEEAQRDITVISGDVPSPRQPPSGCRFRTRCPHIIPPDEMDIDQQSYRAIQTIRQRIDDRAFTIPEDASVETTVEQLYDRTVDSPLPAVHRERLETAFESIAEGKWDAAADAMSAYTSICERSNPELDGDTHSAACHLD